MIPSIPNIPLNQFILPIPFYSNIPLSKMSIGKYGISGMP